MPDDWTPEEHTLHAGTAQLSGSICAVVALLLGLLCAGHLIAGHWEALPGLAVAAWLLHTANHQYALADTHHSAAALSRQGTTA